ncbi:MAG: hypothetical protein IKU52_01455 [Clostridia bacterium]|nr:hypothetical protein [Clostridia bacterium]
MKKRILILLLSCLILTGVFAGCSEKKEVKETEVETVEIPENVDPSDYYGCWKYAEDEEWIVIKEDGNYEMYDIEGILITSREYIPTPDGIYIPEMDITLYFDDRGVLCTDDGFEMMKTKEPK